MEYQQPLSSLPEYYAGLNVPVFKHDSTDSKEDIAESKFNFPSNVDIANSITIYSNDDALFLVGNRHNSYRLLIIHRNERYNKSINLSDDNKTYLSEQIKNKLEAFKEESNGKWKEVGKGFNILGIYPLVDSIYISLITNVVDIGWIGGKRIQQITETKLIQINKEEKKDKKNTNEIEERYKSLLFDQGVLENCYISFTYDLTRSLQDNMTILEFEGKENFKFNSPNDMFIWNRFLLHNFSSHLDPKSRAFWVLPIIKGFFKQQCLSVEGNRTLRLTLIARRSRHWAGTRYLRRGVSNEGFCANEVESEVILQNDLNGSGSYFSSNVFIRASIPLFWKQENVSNLKPDMKLLPEKGVDGLIKHFEYLFSRYGAPVVVMNLIKKHEKSKQIETIIGESFMNNIQWLNVKMENANNLRSSKSLEKLSKTFLLAGPDQERLKDEDRLKRLFPTVSVSPDATKGLLDNPISYISFDFLNAKEDDLDVMNVLLETTNSCFLQTGFFFTNTREAVKNGKSAVFGTRQCGIFRVNCMDCLDRTNVCQFSYARTVVRHQLKAIGLDANNEDYTQVWLILLKMFEDHGDTIAMQYGGSGAMHKATESKEKESKDGVKAEKTANITSGAGNALVAIQRYYSNNVTDIQKQQAYNVFHGLHLPKKDAKCVWDDDLLMLMNNYESCKHIIFDKPGSSCSLVVRDEAVSNNNYYQESTLTSLSAYLQGSFNVPSIEKELKYNHKINHHNTTKKKRRRNTDEIKESEANQVDKKVIETKSTNTDRRLSDYLNITSEKEEDISFYKSYVTFADRLEVDLKQQRKIAPLLPSSNASVKDNTIISKISIRSTRIDSNYTIEKNRSNSKTSTLNDVTLSSFPEPGSNNPSPVRSPATRSSPQRDPMPTPPINEEPLPPPTTSTSSSPEKTSIFNIFKRSGSIIGNTPPTRSNSITASIINVPRPPLPPSISEGKANVIGEEDEEGEGKEQPINIGVPIAKKLQDFIKNEIKNELKKAANVK